MPVPPLDLDEVMKKLRARVTKPAAPSPPDPLMQKELQDLLVDNFNSRAKAREALIAAMMASDDLDEGARKDLLSEAVKAYEFATFYNMLQAFEVKGSFLASLYKKSFGEAAVKHIRQLKLLADVLIPPKKEEPPAA